MVQREQARPLAPATERPSSDEEDTTQHPQTQLIKRCACPLIFLLLLATVIIVLIFTIFRVKDPVITMNGVRIASLQLVNPTTLQAGANMSLIADVSVKNPNVASFRYGNTTTSLHYHGVMVGEARGPPGRARARRTIRINVTVDVITNRVLSSPNFTTDFGSGLFTMTSFSIVPGKVNIFNLFKRQVVVKMNCTTTFNISTQGIKEQTCKQKVKL
ncbi:hypothetical protein VNO78_25183 [Psophocarpus tetragonolobus]|uniref:Late embryogenesis abundant protein LEA-2 subgroup domain-containing protein n=1 Tax=Psophocarpus tetragonolobus TaxID=3891 RepID=A0AAN9S6M6_PSOTE